MQSIPDKGEMWLTTSASSPERLTDISTTRYPLSEKTGIHPHHQYVSYGSVSEFATRQFTPDRTQSLPDACSSSDSHSRNQDIALSALYTMEVASISLWCAIWRSTLGSQRRRRQLKSVCVIIKLLYTHSMSYLEHIFSVVWHRSYDHTDQKRP